MANTPKNNSSKKPHKGLGVRAINNSIKTPDGYVTNVSGNTRDGGKMEWYKNSLKGVFGAKTKQLTAAEIQRIINDRAKTEGRKNRKNRLTVETNYSYQNRKVTNPKGKKK